MASVASSVGLGSLPYLRFEGDLNLNWIKFKRQLLSFIDAYFVEADDKQKLGILLHHGGELCQEVFASLPENSKVKSFDEILSEFDNHFLPKRNVTYERYLLFKRKQLQEESFEHFITVLKNLSATCELGDIKEDLIKDLFICGIKSTALQKQLLSIPNITLDKALDMCRTYTAIDTQVQMMDKNIDIKEAPEVDEIKNKGILEKRNSKKLCLFCGFNHSYGRCPAFGKICMNCKKMNHFAKQCKSKRTVNLLENVNIDTTLCDEFQVNGISEFHKKCSYTWYLTFLYINGFKVQLKVDTGAQCNILSLFQFASIGGTKSDIIPTNINITSFTDQRVSVVGKVILKCKFKDNWYNIEFFIVDQKCSNILGLKTSEGLGLIQRLDAITMIPEINTKAYDYLFDGEVGCYPQEIKLEVDPNIKPVVSPAPSNLMSRQLRSNIPSSSKILLPKVTYKNDRKKLIKLRQKSKLNYDKTAKVDDHFKPGQFVMFQKYQNNDKLWYPGKIITEHSNPRSYIVEAENGRKYIRNQINIKSRLIHSQTKSNFSNVIKDMPNTCYPEIEYSEVNDNISKHSDVIPNDHISSTEKDVRYSRAGRLIKCPSRYKDYQLYN
ncbi:hypothetical protein ACJJTC_003779 [Scirpophaga incertulas]